MQPGGSSPEAPQDGTGTPAPTPIHNAAAHPWQGPAAAMDGQDQTSSRAQLDKAGPSSSAAVPGLSAALLLPGAESAWQNPDPRGARTAAAEAEAATPSRLCCAESAGSGSGTRAPGSAAARPAEVWPGVEERAETQVLKLQEAHALVPPAAPGTAEQACHAAGGRGHAPGVMKPEQQNAALPAFASAANRALNDAVRKLEAQVIATLKNCRFLPLLWTGLDGPVQIALNTHKTGLQLISVRIACLSWLCLPSKLIDISAKASLQHITGSLQTLAELVACASAGGCGVFGAARDVRPRRRHGSAPEACAGAHTA